MLDLKLILEQTIQIKEKLATRGYTSKKIDELLSFYKHKRELQVEADTLRHKRKTISKQIGILKSKGESIEVVMSEVANLKSTLENLESEEKEIDGKIQILALGIPNLPQDGIPVGNDESANEEVRRWGSPRSFDFEPKAHYEIGESLGVLDFEGGAKISGSGFTLYHGSAARLERALVNFMLDTHTENGYEEKWLPFLVGSESLQGTGQLPKFEEDLYHIEGENLFLNPTAEVALTNIYRDQILNEKDLSISITAYAPSFRKEAGSYGKDTRGLIRQHQFNKVELVKLTRPEDSEKEHQAMLAEAELILQKLNLPYRVVVLSTGDMGFSASKCYDIEVWLPSMNQYKEISSVSNCLTFQARRANIRFKRDNGSKPEFVHTLNGSGLAVGRTLVAVFENYQNEGGSVTIPDVLHPYFGKVSVIK